MFSIVMASRSGITEFSGPIKFLQNALEKSKNHNNFEIIIRCDEDDKLLQDLESSLSSKNFPFPVKLITGLKLSGYLDLHKFYNECLLKVSDKSKFIFSLPEDVTINIENWDQILIDEYHKARKEHGHPFFTMHQTLSPGDLNIDACIETPDPFPIYSREWLSVCNGISHTGANDSWVQCIHHYLIKNHGIFIKHFLPHVIFDRNIDAHDLICNKRWSNERLQNHEMLRKNRTQKIMASQAQAIYNNIISESTIEKNHLNITTPYEEEYINYLCKKYGSASILFKAYAIFTYDASKELLESTLTKIDSICRKILILKTIIPNINPYHHNIYHPNIPDNRNLTKPIGNIFGALDSCDKHEVEAAPLIKKKHLKNTIKQIIKLGDLKELRVALMKVLKNAK